MRLLFDLNQGSRSKPGWDKPYLFSPSVHRDPGSWDPRRTDEDIVTVEVLSSNVGRIIGRGGCKIREIEETSGAKIKVPRDEAGESVFVEISGSKVSKVIAKDMIIEICDSAHEFDGGGRRSGGDGFQRPRDNASSGGFREDKVQEIQIQSAFIGRIIGRGGSKIRELEETSGARIKVPKNASEAVVIVELQGPDSAKDLAQKLILDICKGAGDQDCASGRGNGRGLKGSRGGGGFGGRSGDDFGDEEMEVSHRDVGRLLGRGGSRIRQLQNDSGARIRVQSERSNGITVPVVISGSEDARMKAMHMIADICDPY